jgi:tetratricopeptide (TPR) repeat protein
LNLDDTTNRKLLANLLFNRHQEDNAIQLLLEARTIEPNDAELYFNLGVAYDRAWNRSKLMKDVSPAISKKYKRDAIQNFQNYLMLAKRADDGKTWPHVELAEIMVDNIRKGARIVY